MAKYAIGNTAQRYPQESRMVKLEKNIRNDQRGISYFTSNRWDVTGKLPIFSCLQFFFLLTLLFVSFAQSSPHISLDCVWNARFRSGDHFKRSWTSNTNHSLIYMRALHSRGLYYICFGMHTSPSDSNR